MARKILTTEALKFLREDRVLVYHYRANGTPVVKGGLAVVSRRELEDILQKHPTLQRTTKAVPPRTRNVDIHQRDLLPAVGGSQQEQNHGTEASNVAGVKFPVHVWLEGLLRGKGQGWSEIVVVSERAGAAPTSAPAPAVATGTMM